MYKESIQMLLEFFLKLFLDFIKMLTFKEAKAKNECLNNLIKLKKLLISLSRYSGSPSRSENGYYERLKEIQDVIDVLNIANAKLSVPCILLKEALIQSLKIFDNLDPYHANPAYRSAFSASSLVYIWEKVNPFKPKFKHIGDIQGAVNKCVPKRFLGWNVYDFVSTVKDG